jgi:hypothetical protein
MLNLHRLTSCTLLYSSSLRLACFCRVIINPPAYFFSFGIPLTYVDAWARITENTRQVIATQRWLDLQKTHHLTAKHCCDDVVAHAQAVRTQRKDCSSMFGRVCVTGGA